MLGARSIIRIHWRASGGIVDIASATMLKNSETFFIIFMLSPRIAISVGGLNKDSRPFYHL